MSCGINTHGNRDRAATTRSCGATKVARKHSIARDRTGISVDEGNTAENRKRNMQTSEEKLREAEAKTQRS